MPKLNLGLNMDQGVAEGFEAWSGPLPANGSYTGKLKIVQMAKTSQAAKNPGANMLKIGVELIDAGECTGYVAFRNLTLVDASVPFINQFLRALTDGSDAQLAKIQKAFNESLLLADDQKNVLRIGGLKINSPTGELPIKVTVKQRSWQDSQVPPQTHTTAGVDAFLLSDNGSAAKLSGNGDSEEIIAEDDSVDESIFNMDDDEDETA